MIILGLFFSLIVVNSCAQELEKFEVNIAELGTLRGTIYGTLPSLTPYYQVQGIPYGTLEPRKRFRPSKLNEERLGTPDNVFDATFLGHNCVQPSTSIKSFGFEAMEEALKNLNQKAASGNEDCLNINVYFKDLPTEGMDLKPVIVFIHGGAFTSGSSDLYQAHRLLEHDVIFVTFNYRLGVLGFFSLGTEDAPGNAGLYDMVTALQWINKYIQHFGGDPKSVTITGQSAGAAAVTHLMSSKLAEGLFHKAIALSGSGLNAWGTTTSAKAKAASLKIAEKMECYTPIPGIEPKLDEITDCMNNERNMTRFVEALAEYQMEERYMGRLGFDGTSPVIQDFPLLKPFLTESPLDIFKAGKQQAVPFMTGATKHDGSFPLAVLYRSYLEPKGLLTDATYLRKNLLRDLLSALGIIDETDVLYDAIGSAYLKDAKDSGNFTMMMPGLIDINSVFFFKNSIYHTLELHSKLMKSSSYYYSFDYRSLEKTLFGLLFGFNPPPIYGGVTHSDDLMYLFAIPFFNDLSEEEMNVSRQMTLFWANFARTGNPTPFINKNGKDSILWPSFGSSNEEYLIADKQFTIGKNYRSSWEDASDELVPVTVTSPAQSTTTETYTTTTPASQTSTTEGQEASTTESSSSKPAGFAFGFSILYAIVFRFL